MTEHIKFFSILFLGAILFTGCGQTEAKKQTNLVITNSSSDPIKKIAVQREGKTDLAFHQDGSAIMMPDEAVSFYIEPERKCKFYIDITDTNDNLYHSGEFRKDFELDGNTVVTLVIDKDALGIWQVKEEKEEAETVEESADIIEKPKGMR